jgi:dTDP-4-amino-4,6-dideoxygalactose transaminase
MKYLKKHKILAQFHYIPIYNFTIYKEKKIELEGTEKYFKNSISIPMFVNLKKEEQKKIIYTIKKYFK